MEILGQLGSFRSEIGVNGLTLLESYQRGLNPNVPIISNGVLTFTNGFNVLCL